MTDYQPEHTAAPGSRVERAASAAAQATPDAAAVEHARNETASPVAGQIQPVPVDAQPCEEVAYTTWGIAPGAIQRVAGRNDQRRSLQLHAVTTGAYLCRTQELAEFIAAQTVVPPFAAPGFWLAPGTNLPLLPLRNNQEAWAANPAGAAGTAYVSATVEWRTPG